jgi:hypothetical protein
MNNIRVYGNLDANALHQLSTLEQLINIAGGNPGDISSLAGQVGQTYVTENHILAETKPFYLSTSGWITNPIDMASEKTVIKTNVKKKIMEVPPGFRHGGIKTPHLHLNDELYMLTQAQWDDFSNKVKQTFSEKLAKTKTVTSEQLKSLSEGMNKIT